MTKKRLPKRRPKPTNLDQVRGLELNGWAVNGPLIAGPYSTDAVRTFEGAGYIVWASWDEWATFYAGVRDAYLSSRRVIDNLACERLFEAIVAGQDPADVRRQIAAEQAANDPRHVLRSSS
jgi:hypothetical protein